MEHLLFAAYLILFAWLVTKVRFFTNSGLTNAQLVIFFLLKVIAGILYGWIGLYYGELAKMLDTWTYHYESLHEYQLLKTNPLEFFTNIFQTPHPDGFKRFLSEDSWWNDLKGNFFVKILAIFDLFSFGHYYINVVFYSFLSLFGPIALYRVMQNIFASNRLAVLIATFLVPSFLYWTSGLHRDGIIFIGFGLIIFQFYFGFKEKKFAFSRIILILFSTLLILGSRNFYVIPLIPAILAWVLSEKLKFRPIFIFTAVYLFFITLFFAGKYIHPRLDFPAAVVEKQQAFMRLQGGSTINVSQLQPTPQSFLLKTPEALSLTALRPYPSDVHHLLSLAAASEIGFLLLLFVVFLIWRKNGVPLNPFLLFAVFFAFSVLLMIGYTVNNLGAIVRYRSVILPFLIVPVVARINWSRIGDFFIGDISKNKNL